VISDKGEGKKISSIITEGESKVVDPYCFASKGGGRGGLKGGEKGGGERAEP